eukprot:CAMPEP_0113620730 /NCGR_PEP_ID=MMETSP0017_2-20120614/10571_1 /TAXON_ID=2856 /ORGANISM="Cylindrotheca closterium" /LENGTH=390 /DNA_ID=CAMNT_0000530415 /DNA_START=198 /DNA_END=1370 /DNA_ORIENTATION=- /assembly_acc=CAM_ASM_000147
MASSAMAPLPSMLRSPFQQESSKSHQRTQHRQAVPSPKQQSSNSDNNNNSNNNNNKWTLCSPLPSVPAGYMLERNQIHVSNNSGKTKPQEIANRVAESLQIRGFTVTETDSDIKNAIRAESHKGLLFRVNFFLPEDSNEGVLVEFQRLAGCSYEFQRAYQAVHRYVLMEEETAKQELLFPTCLVPPNKTTTDNNKKKEELATDTFAIALDLMQSEQRLDSQLMGLESMEPLSTRPEILPLLFDKACLQTLLKFCTPSNEPLNKLEAQQDCLLKRRALSILANGLETLSSSSASSSSFAIVNNNNDLLDCLCKCCNNCNCNDSKNNDPHQSFQVARCLVEIAKQDPSSHALIQEKSLVSLLSKQPIKHLALEQECQKLEAILLSSFLVAIQ